jgi:hypothetical protein
MPVSIAPSQSYQGTIWLEYTNSTTQPGTANPWIMATAAVINLTRINT